MSMSVCLTVRSHNSKTTRPNFTKFLFMLPMALSQSSSGRDVTVMYFQFCRCRHVFTEWPYGASRFFLAAIEYKHNSRPNLLNGKCQQVLLLSCALGAKSAIYGCLVCFCERQERHQQLICQLSNSNSSSVSETGGWCDNAVQMRHYTDRSVAGRDFLNVHTKPVNVY